MSNNPIISIVVGSVRPERQGSRAVQFLQRSIQNRNWTIHIVDPMQTPAPFLEARYMDYQQKNITPPAPLEAIAKIFAASDAFLFVSPEYNYSIPPALSNLVDHYRPEFKRKPVGIVTYSMGPFGGVRAGVQLYTLVAALGAVSVPDTLPIPAIQTQLDEQGKPINKDMQKFVTQFLDEVEWYIQTLRSARS